MSKTLNSIVYDIHSTEKDVVVLRDYASDASQLSYKRTAPKRLKDFPGMEKTELKHTVTGADGSIIGIQTVTTSIRADAAEAVRSSLNATTQAALADSAYTDLVQNQRLPLSI